MTGMPDHEGRQQKVLLCPRWGQEDIPVQHAYLRSCQGCGCALAVSEAGVAMTDTWLVCGSCILPHLKPGQKPVGLAPGGEKELARDFPEDVWKPRVDEALSMPVVEYVTDKRHQ